MNNYFRWYLRFFERNTACCYRCCLFNILPEWRWSLVGANWSAAL